MHVGPFWVSGRVGGNRRRVTGPVVEQYGRELFTRWSPEELRTLRNIGITLAVIAAIFGLALLTSL